MNEPSPDPFEVASNTPMADDRLLLELTNSMQTADDLIRAQGREGFFARWSAKLTGADRRRRQHIAESTLSANRATVEWVEKLSRHQGVTNLAVAEALDGVREVRLELEAIRAARSEDSADIERLSKALAELARDTVRYLEQHEQRLDRLECLREVEKALRNWRFPQPGAAPQPPRLFAAVLLVREVAGGPVGEQVFTGRVEADEIRRELVDGILRQAPGGWHQGARSVMGLLAEAVAALAGADQRLMMAEILGVGLHGRLALPTGALTAALAGTAQRAADAAPAAAASEAARAARAARAAVLAHRGFDDAHLPLSMDAHELVNRIVIEQFAEAYRRRDRLKGAGTGDEREPER